ncbi:hypothetical protein Pelo_17803 [Pelomyxa schiedti]|nr:hypothetical protein Pelo_17803 [Pelomyxa schiedti]
MEFWCSVCGCKREAKIQQWTGEIQPTTVLTTTGAVSQVVVKMEEEEPDHDSSASPTPTNPKRIRRAVVVAAPTHTSSSADPASASASPSDATSSSTTTSAALCVMCRTSGQADVAAKYMCGDCTKASRGSTPMLYCESCWSRAHWTPWMLTHVRSDPISAVPGEVSGVKMCESHQLTLDVFCQTDNTFICSRCILYSSHKGHHVVSVEEMSYNNLPSPKSFLGQLSQLESNLKLSVMCIKSESTKRQMDQGQFEETVHKEFCEMRSLLERRQEELISASEAISSYKVCALSRQLEALTAGLEHIDKYKSKCLAILQSCDGPKIIGLCESIPAILKQLECKPEHLSLCESETWTCTDDVAPFKTSIPHLCFISSGPVLVCIREEMPALGRVKGNTVTLHGWWAPSATNQDIRVRVGESECTNVNIVTPGSVLTFTVPVYGVGNDLPVFLSVLGKAADRPNDTRTGDSECIQGSPIWREDHNHREWIWYLTERNSGVT